ncbi:MAG: PBP1A family penicillin-binding protein [Acidobacteriota bacterium]
MDNESHPGDPRDPSPPSPTSSAPRPTGLDAAPLAPAGSVTPAGPAPGRLGSGGFEVRPPREDPPGDDDDRRRARRRRWVRFVVAPLVTAALATATGVGVAASIHRPQVAELDEFVPRLVTEIYDRHGQVVRTYSRENRVMIEDGELPAVVQNAILATEDANFFQHGGVDLKGVARAAWTNLKAGDIKEGASTITMQLARELFSLTREQKWWRKVEEAFLAVELEKNYSKQQLLTLYANLVNLGHGNYGMEAAARAYFNKSVDKLTLAEAATLAGIPQRPSHFSVHRRPEAVTTRRNWVLARMLDVGYISQVEYEEAVAEPLLVTKRRRETLVGPYFTEDVRRHLITTYGETELYDRGLRVRTTLDRDIQRSAERALRERLLELDHRRGWRGTPGQLDGEDLESIQLPSWGETAPLPDEWFEGIVLDAGSKTAQIRHRDTTYELTRAGIEWTGRNRPDRLLKRGNVAWFRLATAEEDGGDGEAPPVLMLEQEPELEGSVLVLESATGAVRAMVGGWDFERNEFNRATQAKRQVGSAFKPFVFGAALEHGFTAADTLYDGPAVFPGANPTENTYSPRNHSRKYYGIVTLRRALEASINVTAVKLMDLVGVDRTIDFARRCGVTSDLPPYPSLALGSADMVPLELAAAYATFVNQGIYVEPYTIETVVSRNDRTLFEHHPRAHKAMEPQIAHVVTSMLAGVSKRGTAAGLLGKLDIETGGKTGTTNAYTDAWFVGFTPRHTILTWVGYDKKRSIGRGMTGAAAALPIWHGVVQQGLEDQWLQPGETFDVPTGIVTVPVEARSGLLWGSGGERMIEEVFLEGTQPERAFDPEMARIMALPWYLQEPYYLPKEGERMPSQIADWSTVKEVWQQKNRREEGL